MDYVMKIKRISKKVVDLKDDITTSTFELKCNDSRFEVPVITIVSDQPFIGMKVGALINVSITNPQRTLSEATGDAPLMKNADLPNKVVFRKEVKVKKAKK